MAVCTPGDVPSIITGYLGFECEGANPIVTIRNPADLEHWTQPVLEVTIILGAVLALIHAIRRLRRDGDPTNLTVWIGSLVYLFVIEPPLYFPNWFHAEEAMGFMFSHNVFTVMFMYDRLPLYIVAFYPAVSQVAYELVRAWGFFDGSKRSALRGSLVLALVFQTLLRDLRPARPAAQVVGVERRRAVLSRHPRPAPSPGRRPRRARQSRRGAHTGRGAVGERLAFRDRLVRRARLRRGALGPDPHLPRTRPARMVVVMARRRVRCCGRCQHATPVHSDGAVRP